MNVDPYVDTTWETALGVTRRCLVPPSVLARLVQNSWRNSISMKDFLHAVDTMSFPSAAFVRAARILDDSIADRELAVTKLGFKGAASVAAVHFACGAIAAKCKSEKLRTLFLQRIMDAIEIGYHFGLSTAAIGPETGVLIGFAQSIGGPLLVVDRLSSVEQVEEVLNNSLSRREYIQSFDCEPYQVSSLALQRLGFGSSFASAAVLALGHTHSNELVTSDQMVRDWWAASDWIAALIAGEERPKRKSSLEHFPELLHEAPPSCEIPLHLQALTASIDTVRDTHSRWDWHSTAS